MTREVPVDAVILAATDAGGRVLLVRQRAGPFAGAWLLPGGGARRGEPLEEALVRETLEETGAHATDLRPVIRYEVLADRPERSHFHVHLFRGRADGGIRAEEGSAVAWRDVRELEPHPVLARELADAGLIEVDRRALRDRLRSLGIRMTALGLADDRAWFEEVRGVLEDAYLSATDPAAQSGKGGGLARWEVCRGPIAVAVHRGGTFLDVGCANGLLMESIVRWAAARGHAVEPYGLDLSDRLAALARARLPRWADRVFVGNAMDWTPPLRFDFVRTELEYVPRYRAPELVDRLLGELVAPGGRLIVCGYGTDVAERVGDTLRSWGFPVAGEHEGADATGRVCVRLAWIDSV